MSEATATTDYGDEWRFYAILNEILEGEPRDKEPEVVDSNSDKVQQYP